MEKGAGGGLGFSIPAHLIFMEDEMLSFKSESSYPWADELKFDELTPAERQRGRVFIVRNNRHRTSNDFSDIYANDVYIDGFRYKVYSVEHHATPTQALGAPLGLLVIEPESKVAIQENIKFVDK